GRCRVMTEKDGLLINHISSLCLRENTLWIGYARGRAGGLGRLDLSSGKITTLTPELGSDPLDGSKSDSPDRPPRHAVFGLTMAPGDELWMLVPERGLSRYRVTKN